MKTAEAKISPASSHQSGKKEPFFGHQQEGSVRSIASETAPFFTKPATVQAKLTVGQPNDKYEQEADTVADKVVQKLSEPGTVQATSISPATPAVQAKCAECEKEDKLQKKEEENTVEAVTDIQNETVALPDPPSCPGDGTGNSKSTSATVQLKCSTCEAEESEPKNAEEKKKDELNHLPVQAKLTVGAPNDPFEKEADDVADHVVQKLGDNEMVQSKTDTVLHNGIQSIQAKSGSAVEEAVPAKEEEKKEEVPLEINKKAIDTGVPDPPPPNDEDNRNNNNNTLQRKCNTCFTGNLTPDIHTKPIFESEEQPNVQRRCRECEEGDRIFLKASDILQLAGDLTSKGDGSRESIIAAAKSMLGKIEAKHDDGSGKRVGAEHLLEIFHLAAPGVWDDSTIQTAGAQMPSWCGIFSVWAHKKAGKDIGNWQMGKGVSAFGTLQQTTDPLPGDIGYIDKPYQHHCIVVKVDGDTVHSIDGNSGLYSEVIENNRPRSKFSGFFTAFSGGSTVQRKEESASTVHPSVEDTLSSTKGSGTALPEPVQQSMGTAMGADFSNVKIHTDSSAVQMSKDLNAQAFTHGSDIYFNTGKFNPDSTGGQHLLAHELTHTVQQGESAKSIQKQDAPAEHLTSLNEMLDRFDVPENEVINLLRQLTETERATVNSDVTYRIKMAAAFNTGEMVRAVKILNPSLIQKLEWVEAAAGSAQSIDYSEISSLITSPEQSERDTLKTTRWRDFFVDVCDNSTIITAVTDLHFDLKTQLEWIEEEADPSNIDYSQIQSLITSATQPERDGLKTNRWRDFFVGVCTNETIITAVTDLKFDLKTQLEWIEAEADPSNIDYSDIQSLITSATQPDRDGLKTNRWRDFFVGVCTNKTIITAVTDLKFDLKTQLEWIEAEASPSNIDYSEIKSLITSALQPDRDLLKNNRWRDFFVGVCDNDTMVDAVIDLNFDIKTKMEWMIEEGTHYSGFKRLILVTSAADKATILGDAAFLGILKDYFSTWNNFAKTVELLGRQIPNASMLLANPIVLSALSTAWAACGASITTPGVPAPPGVHEEGGYIYMNIITGAITTSSASPGARASLPLNDPAPPADSITIGGFHTHPNVGPGWGAPFASPPDISWASRNGIPLLIRGAFPTVAATSDVSTGSARLHLAGDREFPGSGGGDAPQTSLDGKHNDI